MPKRIIIADDRENCRENLSEWTKTCCKEKGIDMEVTTVNDGRPLVGRVLDENVPYDLVFTDNMMLRINGMEAISIIRKKDKIIPIYLFCAGDSSIEREAINAGATGYISKLDPNCWDKITEVLYKHLG